MEKRTVRKKIKKEWIWAWIFIFPTIVGAIAFGFYPLIRSVIMMLTEWDGMTRPRFTGLDNFVRLFQDPIFWFELKNTLIFAFVSVPLTMLFSVLLAAALNVRRGPVGLMRVIYYLPSVTMPVAIAAVWKWMFNSKAGIINYLLNLLGISGPNWLSDPDFIMIAVVIVSVWAGMGYNMIILLSALKNIPATYYEAAKIDGGNGFQIFMRLTLPMLSPTLFFLSITGLMSAFKTFDIVYMFCMPGNSGSMPTNTMNALRTMVFGIYRNGFTFMEMGYAAAEAFILLLIILLVTVVQFAGQKRWVNYDI